VEVSRASTTDGTMDTLAFVTCDLDNLDVQLEHFSDAVSAKEDTLRALGLAQEALDATTPSCQVDVDQWLCYGSIVSPSKSLSILKKVATDVVAKFLQALGYHVVLGEENGQSTSS